MRQLIKENMLEIALMFFIFINIFFGLFPVIPTIVIIVAISFYRVGLIGACVLTSFALSTLLGSTLGVIGIFGIASLLQYLVLLMCLYKWLVKHEFKMFYWSEGLKSLSLLFFVLFLSSIITTGGDYAFVKIYDTIFNGVIYFFAFALLLSNPDKCNFLRIGVYLILYSYLMLLLSPLLNTGSGPSGILDFGYLRQQNLLVLEDEKLVIDYQHVGFFATLGAGIIFLSSLWNRLNDKFVVLSLVLCTLSSLYSGARQFMIISIALIVLYVLLSKQQKGKLFYIAIGIGVSVFLLKFLFSEGGMLNSVKEDGYLEASNRDLVLLKGVYDFINSPFLGVGYGRFFFGKYGLYPHNLFVELLCEIGLVGTFIFLCSVIKPIKMIIKNYKPCIYIFVIIFLRSMTSGGMDSNIMMFSFLFACFSLKRINCQYECH